MIEHLHKTCSPLSAVAYHYCDFTDAATLEPQCIAGSLVRQLVEQTSTFPEQVRHAYHEFSRSSVSLNILISILRYMMESCFEAVYFVIDGVDECPTREQLLQLLHTMEKCSAGMSCLNILVSSRPENDLRKAWSTRITFSITPKDVEDSLTIHVREEVASIPKLSQLPQSTRVDLVTQLVARAEGMFRWIECQLNVLRQIRTQRALRVALDSLPMGLVETYDRILDRVAEQDHEYVTRVMKWLIGAEHPLRLAELAEAVAIDPKEIQLDTNSRLLDPEEVLDICGSLLSVRPDGTIVLAHFSVREYLLSDHLAKHTSSLAKFAITEMAASQFVYQSVLSYVFTVGIELHDRSHEIVGESKYPLIQHVELSSITHYHDFDTVLPWAEAHFPLTGQNLRYFTYMIDYTKVPSLIAENRNNSALVQHVLQTALMCYWNGCASREQIGACNKAAKQVEEMFLSLQRKW